MDERNQDQPTNGNSKCEPLPCSPTPPTLAEPAPCTYKCTCPKPPASGETCFDTLIKQQTELLSEAERTKTFKADLEDLLKKGNAAKQGYTNDRYKDFLKRWEAQNAEILRLVERLKCSLDCWECVFECEICRVLHEIRRVDIRLNGDGQISGEVHSLHDVRHWHERNVARATTQFRRIKAVLDAWSDPAKTIEANLAANQKLIDAVKSTIGSDPAEALQQLFLQLLPMHLAIAPRPLADELQAYYDHCDCGEAEPDDCCGPDVGRPSILRGLIGPQAYIVDPASFFDILCCLATERYLPAKDQLGKAESGLALAKADVTTAEAELTAKASLAAVVARYRASVSKPIDCKNYTSNGDGCDDDSPSTAL